MATPDLREEQRPLACLVQVRIDNSNIENNITATSHNLFSLQNYIS